VDVEPRAGLPWEGVRAAEGFSHSLPPLEQIPDVGVVEVDFGEEVARPRSEAERAPKGAEGLPILSDFAVEASEAEEAVPTGGAFGNRLRDA